MIENKLWRLNQRFIIKEKKNYWRVKEKLVLRLLIMLITESTRI